MARSASAPSPSAAKAAVSTSASGGVVEVVSVSFVSFNVSVIWLSSNLPCAWGCCAFAAAVVVGASAYCTAQEVPLPDTDQPGRTVRAASRHTRHRKSRDPRWHTLCNISSVVFRFNCAANEKAVSALETQRAEGQDNEIHMHDESQPAQAPP